ncbi:MAG: hypothetical protein A3C85_01495 [Candidatus Doudnabacteria bacterium RIFCSPHIGHO2_02_FULL_48_21]|uniref:2-oxoglutarate dehydrogenase n=1 Tax=Candidatus Doudnabacteria bacterium RIFCSPLOWO2_02_FULL_48_13 TaxID=1817845 RepID=A0A1F5Q8Q2_9BACT|nr:MAG: hypothetical protein A3K05_03115 [Candidatus Doudnabacteria bacterium RIFCSPHIGHO2_01_48_18]OGE79925.1 MAG: hypothetical protein A2668_01500 [Candidatus Doudnabacteria bacterium RIFCSPHIGHO2_01_FULL_48_180]OGE93957.1 MAG: hypothetical protein A3C85_01495 [Candidatus Doudnabacteria bacterium RIFCSPHIGHO2_02_FULL_48_21]OGE97204.1 MAG: hypothetical protein A3A83_03830 [Candidatus Doudnabacteria bacterium RIFCSPLOWO2_01_FULL_48_57]OGE98506.1 MAG: hypothetical protein A3J05_03350 [Candidatus
MKQNILYIALALAICATLASLYASEALGWEPCVLCWYQRIFMYPLVVILAAGTLRKTRDLEYFVLPLSLMGLALSLYHSLLQYGIIPEQFSPCTSGISCTIPYHIAFNFLTIPLLSFITFAAITVCILIYRKAQT